MAGSDSTSSRNAAAGIFPWQHTRKAVNVSCAVLGAAGLLWLGAALGPRNAHGTVYVRETVQSITQFVAGEPHPVGERLLIVNSNPVLLEISTSKKQPADIIHNISTIYDLDSSRRRQSSFDLFRSQSVSSLESLLQWSEKSNTSVDTMSGIPAEQRAKIDAQRIADRIWSDLAADIGKPVFAEGAGWAAIGVMPGTAIRAIADRAPVATSDPAQDGFFTLAMRTPTDDHTTVWTMRPRGEFDLRNWVDSGNSDVPGDDAEPFTRYPGSRRTFSLIEHSAIGASRVVAYDGTGSIDSHTQHYLGLAAGAGFSLKQKTANSGNDMLLQFSGSQSEVAIFISNSNKPTGAIRDLVQVRQPTG